MNLYYAPDLSTDQLLLPVEEARHCTQVLRLKAGDELFITDGAGCLARAQIESIRKRDVQVNILSRENKPSDRNYTLHMAVAPTKNIDRFEWFLEKATEIGVDAITPILTEHSERKHIRPDRLEKILVAAMKQSLKFHKPALHALCSFPEFLSQSHASSLAIAYCGDVDKTPLKQCYTPGQNITLLIGPEGDFSPSEVEQAIEYAAQVVSLGESRLRTETAGIVACHTISILNQ